MASARGAHGEADPHLRRAAAGVRARRRSTRSAAIPTTRSRSSIASSPRSTRRSCDGGDGRFLLRDLGSLNGTYVRGERVAEHVLKHGDELVLGSTHLMFVEQTRDRRGAPPRHHRARRHSRASSATRSTSQRPTRDFLPEKQICDVENLRRDYEKLRIGHELARAIVGVLDLDQLLPKILDKAFELVPADRGVILLDDEDGKLDAALRQDTHGQETTSRSCSRSRSSPRSSSTRRPCSRRTRRWTRASPARTRSSCRASARRCACRCSTATSCSASCTSTRRSRPTRSPRRICRSSPASRRRRRSRSRTRAWPRRSSARRATRAQFQRLLSPNLVEQLVTGELHLEKGGELREVTILFSDIRGFTSMSREEGAGRDRQHAQRVLRGDGRHPVQRAGHARQVRRRRDHGAVRRAGRHARRAAHGGALRARDAAGAARVQPHARRPRTRSRSGSASASTPAASSPAPSARRARCSTPPSATR